MENSDKAPVTNRGVVNTSGAEIRGSVLQEEQYILVDWIQATVINNDINVFNLFSYLFGNVPVDIEAGGKFGYDKTYYYKNIQIMTAERRKEDGLNDMGFHIYVSGSGCRDIEDLNLDYHVLFRKLLDMGAKFTRLDISVDSFSDKYYTLDLIKEAIKNGEIVSRFKNSIEFEKKSLEDGKNNGYTVWFGSRASNVQIVFYDKMKERESQHFIVSNEIKFWNRMECRFRSEYANEVAINFVHYEDFNGYYLGLVKNYISFRKRSTDSNKSRWPTAKWWSDYLDEIPRVQFQKVNVENNIVKQRRWLEDSVSRTNFMVFLSDINNLTSDEITTSFMFEMLKSGSKKITRKDLQFINDYRLKKGLQPFDMNSIYDFVRDMGDILINKKVG